MERITEIIKILELIEKVSAKYPDTKDTYEMGVKGSLFGLRKYKEKERKVKLLPYLAYFIKTGIEKGIK